MSEKEAFLHVMFTAMEEIEKRSSDPTIHQLLEVILECQVSVWYLDNAEGCESCG